MMKMMNCCKVCTILQHVPVDVIIIIITVHEMISDMITRNAVRSLYKKRNFTDLQL